MIRIENNCVCCDLPCIDCGRRHEEVLYCDCCNHSFERCYNYNGRDLCEDCFFDNLFAEISVEELINLMNYMYQSDIYKTEDNKFYVAETEDEDFEEYSREEFLSFFKSDFNGLSIEEVIEYFGGIDIVTIE